MNAQNPPPVPRSAREMLRMARDFLERNGVAEARLEGELLVAHALLLSRLELFMQLDRPVNGREIDAARDLLVRRGRREPVAYITGRREFYGRAFSVGPGVLIPRPETELLVDRARAIAPGVPDRRLRIADVGTGSGCIAITLALEIPAADVIAIDVSEAAVERARENVRALEARVDVRQGDGIPLLESIAAESGSGFDLLVSNPPYVTREEASALAPEVREHEPEIALFAPAGDPDHWVRELLDHGREILVPGGTLLVELGAAQGPRAQRLARERGWEARVQSDLAGIDRVLEARRGGDARA
jgi:release factor glutamine methyltransferase